MLGALLRGVSTREYKNVIPEMAATVGVKRSSISRHVIEASAEQLRQLRERRWEAVEILVIYIDGQRFGAHHLISAVGVDVHGHKHVLGIEPGATENAASVKRLLLQVRDHGLPTDRKYLFVIDGAKAVRAAIDESLAPGLMRAAWKVRTAEQGEKRLEQLARFLERDFESAARSLREGLAEMFTLHRLQLPPSLIKCLATTNIIESPQGGVQKKTGNVPRWRGRHPRPRFRSASLYERSSGVI